MGNKIVVIASIIFSLVFAIFLLSVFGNVMKFGDTANRNIQTIQQNIESADLETYNDKIVSGDTVISTINKMKSTKNGYKLSYGVCSGSAGTSSNWDFYGYKGLEFSSSAGASSYYITTKEPQVDYVSYKTSLKPGDSGYISPVDEFNTHIITNENGVIMGIVFIKA